jgi:proteasome assembly chaperone (PAC2) family protein
MASGHSGPASEALRWLDRPDLEDPVLIAAFEGWNDAGDAASEATRHLAARWGAEPVAEIDSEEFFVFTDTRPEVRLDEDGERQIDWPENIFRAGRITGRERDVVILTGTEPQLRWRTFVGLVLDIASSLDAAMVVTLGALLTDIPHTRPTSIIGTAADDDLVDRLDLQRSTYEGPTGIVGALSQTSRAAGFPTVSLWAGVPSYVPGSPSPKAQLALVERTADLLDASVSTTDLEIAAAAYERQIDELVSDDADSVAYVGELERAYDDADLSGDSASLVDEVEEFLRDN